MWVWDPSGSSSDCNATVTVKDVTNPVAKCKNITIDLDATGHATIVAADIDGGSTDACGVSLSASKTSFDCSKDGCNTVALAVTDPTSTSSKYNETVTVQDVTNPAAK